MKVYLKAAHSDFSPGAVFSGRREYDDVLKFARTVKNFLEGRFGISAQVFVGKMPCEMKENDMLIELHRSSNMKNCEKYGAFAAVKDNSSVHTQYQAYRMLMGLCSVGGFRYGGVHTLVPESPYKSFISSKCEKAFLFTLGYIDSQKDNAVLDSNGEFIAYQLSFRISEIIKESQCADNC